MDFDYTSEQQDLRDAVAKLGKRYGHEYFVRKAKAGEHTDELWDEAAKLGYLGVNVPEEYGGGGGGIAELAIVCEELAAAGCPLLLLVVSPAIAARSSPGTAPRRRSSAGCPASPTARARSAFAITEPDAGSNSHKLVHRGPPRRRRLGAHRPQGLHLRRRRGSQVARRGPDGRGRETGKLKPALFVVPTDAPGLTCAERHGDRRRRRTSSCCSSTTCGCPPTRWSARTGRRAAGSCSPA